ncbi:hypothetical protein PC113_g9706, partial [Phytophthora cactorum]
SRIQPSAKRRTGVKQTDHQRSFSDRFASLTAHVERVVSCISSGSRFQHRRPSLQGHSAICVQEAA